MSQVLITGATGLVGGNLLRMLLNYLADQAHHGTNASTAGDTVGIDTPMIRS